tara:strand:+ start:184 stop:897 length:714 start_codon:yes stop_codon:yes gene_type:complete
MKKINYFSNIGFQDGLEFESYLPSDYILPPKKWIGEQEKNALYTKCPAWKEWGKNTWIMYQQFDIEFEYISAEKRIISNLVEQQSFDNYFWVHPDWLDGEHPSIQLKDIYIYWTKEKDVWVEQIPHPLLSRYGLEVIPGTFPISVWQRPLLFGFNILDYDVNIKIPRGTPLYYIRFYSRKNDSLFSLNRETIPKEVMESQKQVVRLKDYDRFASWNLIQQRLKKEESSCPFDFLWKK